MAEHLQCYNNGFVHRLYLHIKETKCVSSTIGDDGSHQAGAWGGDFCSAYNTVHANVLLFDLVLPHMCNVTRQVLGHFPNSHKETTCFIPLLPRTGAARSAQRRRCFFRFLEFTAMCSSISYYRKVAMLQQRVWALSQCP
jgi:hypothetical protein